MGTEATSKDAEMAPQQHTHHTPSLLLRATAHRVDEEYENGAGNNNDNKDRDDGDDNGDNGDGRDAIGQQPDGDTMMGHQGSGEFFCFFQVDFVF